MLVIYLLAFVSLPDEAAYLIPLVPFVLLFAWFVAPPLVFRIGCGLLLLSPWVGWAEGKIAAGYVVQDHEDRISDMQQCKMLLDLTARVSGSNAYIVGSWAPPIAVVTADHPRISTQYLYLVSKPELEVLRAKGWHVWYFPAMREFDARVYKFDIARYGARDVMEVLPREP
jgi:hypothetical protein